MLKFNRVIFTLAMVLMFTQSCGGGTSGNGIIAQNPESYATAQDNGTSSTAVDEIQIASTGNILSDTSTITDSGTILKSDQVEIAITSIDTSTDTINDSSPATTGNFSDTAPDATVAPDEVVSPDAAQTQLSRLAADKESFTLVVLPDSQHVTVDFPDIFISQLQWTYDNIEKEDIAFVLHEGDVTHYNNEVGWDNASLTYEIIDAKVPVAFAVGNHDMEFPKTMDTTLFNTYFPISRYSDYDYFGGTYPEGTHDNSYHLFSAGGTDWLVMCIRYLPSQDILNWADSVANVHADRKIIVVTHAFIDETATIGHDAQNLWNNFVSTHENISMVFNGHYVTGQAGRATFTGDHGNTIQAMFANYQKSAYGGRGYMRLVRVNPSTGTIEVKTYSPWTNEFMTDSDNEFTLKRF